MCFNAGAQEADTMYLSEVEVHSSIEKYTRGMQVTRADSIQRHQYAGHSLGDLLQESTSIYLRQYGGEGQVSTISFRGTTPNHTRVNWNGVDINSQTLGLTDFSSIPVFLFSDIELYHGASSVLFGSGAIGSTINLQGNLLNKKGLYLSAAQQVGSFGKYFSGIKAAYGQEQWSVYMASLHNQVENDFEVPYRNTTYRQNNAASRLFGWMGGARYRLTPLSSLSLETWYNAHDRESQPVIGDLNSRDHLLDKNLRMNLTYKNGLTSGFIQSSFSYTDDRQTYNENSYFHLTRYRWDADYEYSGFSQWNLRTGGEITYALPEVSSYESDTRQLRGGLFLLTEYKPDLPLLLSINVRKPYLQGASSPIVPSVGFEYEVINQPKAAFSVLAQGARSFRFPTLNDLFWQPGGDPNLKPEDGITAETGMKYALKQKHFSLNATTTFYRSWLTDMIIWIPNGAFSYPENVREVEIIGVDVQVSLQHDFQAFKWHGSFNYSYNHSQNKAGLNDHDRSVGKQLAYVPYHKGTMVTAMKYQTWSMTYLQSFTGARFTEATNTARLAGFSVANVQMSKTIVVRDHQLTIGLESNNLWDTVYQNYEMRATPGRNYLIRINYQFN